MQPYHWKRLFFFLLGVNITGLFILLLLFNLPLEDENVPPHADSVGDRVLFNVKAERNEVNRLIAHYIRKEAPGPFPYSIRLEGDEIILAGEMDLAGKPFHFKMTFAATALKNGDLLLEQKQFSLGRISLPVPVVLQIIAESYPFPEWITFQPSKQRIYVSLYNMKRKSGGKLKVKEFDLEQDRFEFLYEFPLK